MEFLYILDLSCQILFRIPYKICYNILNERFRGVHIETSIPISWTTNYSNSTLWRVGGRV